MYILTIRIAVKPSLFNSFAYLLSMLFVPFEFFFYRFWLLIHCTIKSIYSQSMYLLCRVSLHTFNWFPWIFFFFILHSTVCQFLLLYQVLPLCVTMQDSLFRTIYENLWFIVCRRNLNLGSCFSMWINTFPNTTVWRDYPVYNTYLCNFADIPLVIAIRQVLDLLHYCISLIWNRNGVTQALQHFSECCVPREFVST